MNPKKEEINKTSSSLNSQVTRIINTSIYLLLYKLGVELEDPNVLETATEAFVNYIQLLGQISSSIALAAGRTQINLIDAQKAIKCLDNKRYEQIFLLNNEPNSNENCEDQFEMRNISKTIIPKIYLDGNISWKDSMNSSNKQCLSKDNLPDSELFEFVDSIPKHIPEFLPTFPPRLYYSENKFHSN